MTKSDWIISDGTESMYVTGDSMGLEYPADVGKNVIVRGVVRVKDKARYLEVPRAGRSSKRTPTPPSTTTPTTTTIPAVAGVPHVTAGFEKCLVCHRDGLIGATRVPASHTGRSDDTCLACHRQWAVPVAIDTLPPQAPATHAGRTESTCRACHDSGATPGATQTPSSHVGRADCLTCHKLAGG